MNNYQWGLGMGHGALIGNYFPCLPTSPSPPLTPLPPPPPLSQKNYLTTSIFPLTLGILI